MIIRDLIGKSSVEHFDSYMAKEFVGAKQTTLKDAMKFREFWKEIDMLLIQEFPGYREFLKE